MERGSSEAEDQLESSRSMEPRDSPPPRRLREGGLVSKSQGAQFVVLCEDLQSQVFIRPQAATGLVAHLDADDKTVAERHAELAKSLQKAGEHPREDGEPIIELVPKRNIETWLYALDASLSGGPLDEETKYSKFKDSESRCAKAAEAFADHARKNTEPSNAKSVPSLLDGLAEFKRQR